MSDKRKSRGLGRGLSALMADVSRPDAEATATQRPPDRTLPIEVIVPNPDQPRKTFPAEALEDLAASIRSKGVIQPLIVRPSPSGEGKFEIVAGERRWRAAQQAQLHELPVIVRDLSDGDVLEIAIIENIQRADLNPVEEAQGYRQLIERFGHTQEQLAQALGKSRSHIANLMRLLQLPEPVLEDLRAGRLSAGHARALIPSADPVALARKVIAESLSVRETEALVRDLQERDAATPPPAKPKAPEKDADTRALEQDLSAQLAMRVRIEHKDISGAGQMVISYGSLDQLDRLCAILSSVPLDETI